MYFIMISGSAGSLDKEMLTESVLKAKNELNLLGNTTKESEEVFHTQGLQVFHDKFFLRLIHNLFENREQMYKQAYIQKSYSKQCAKIYKGTYNRKAVVK